MSFNFDKVFESKRVFHQKLATRPIAEKLALLDVLRERQLAIRGSADRAKPSSALHEGPPPYGAKSKTQ
jgi:hypothetical protein